MLQSQQRCALLQCDNLTAIDRHALLLQDQRDVKIILDRNGHAYCVV